MNFLYSNKRHGNHNQTVLYINLDFNLKILSRNLIRLYESELGSKRMIIGYAHNEYSRNRACFVCSPSNLSLNALKNTVHFFYD